MSRMAMLAAGLPSTVPIYAVNRQCASGVREDDGTCVTSTTIVHMIGYYLLLRMQQRNIRYFSTV